MIGSMLSTCCGDPNERERGFCSCQCHTPPATECRVRPAYVVRCCHLEGDERVVWLISDAAATTYWDADPCNLPGHSAPRHGWAAMFGTPTPQTCRCTSGMWASTTRWRYTDTRARAAAAFERYESILLGREADA